MGIFDKYRARAAEEQRAHQALQQLRARSNTALASVQSDRVEFDSAQAMLDRFYRREHVENDWTKAEVRVRYLECPEPAPVLEAFLPPGYGVPLPKQSPEILADMQHRYATTCRAHATRERWRIQELEYAKATLMRLQAEALARDLERQAGMWPRGANLCRDIAQIHGIEPQVAAQNTFIERTVEAVTDILADGLASVGPIKSSSPGGPYDPQSVVNHAESALSEMTFDFDYHPAARAAYTPESHQLVIECELPDVSVIPKAKTYRYVKSRNQITETARPASQVKALYANAIAQLTLLFLAQTFASDFDGAIDVAVLNGVVDTLDPRSGQPARPCLITVRVTRDTYAGINLANVDPQACLKHLSAGVSKSPTELAPVKPVLEFSMVDPRFVAATDAISAMDDRPNLLELSPTEFEGLIQNLFTKMGLEARQTRASRDGGVDCIAYDTRPIFGGKVVIQAKRYKNTVGVSAVRDLYGTLQNEGASKGILVTTSGYGQASFDFAQNKPIELIEGANLLYLLETHAGVRARIEPPDDWRDPVPDTPNTAPADP
ncbi:restriction endonuclease [Mycolicibacterium sp. J2]|uniref:restriction endonuclease n=1 Tax=Mycolicibacterium sp. J2 TaxID=2993511 RepID=UPI00224B0DC4|nr:restriction endonuclease [Mycolicibacterium sp. J2]MCX2714027.1 restriction endonuclease [Mycolicibacterium sp. J2]